MLKNNTNNGTGTHTGTTLNTLHKYLRPKPPDFFWGGYKLMSVLQEGKILI